MGVELEGRNGGGGGDGGGGAGRPHDGCPDGEDFWIRFLGEEELQARAGIKGAAELVGL